MSEIFAKRLRQCRLNKGKTQTEMAQVMGVTNVGYGGWERNDSEPSIMNLIKLCTFFGVSSDWLIGLDTSVPRDQSVISGRLNAMRSEADQAAQTLSRLIRQLQDMEREEKA